MKRDAYEECYRAIEAIWNDEGGDALDDIALMSTINSVLANRFDTYFWTGFYRVCGDRLVVGPYIGTLGCLQIEFGRGVCGTAAARRETVIVPSDTPMDGLTLTSNTVPIPTTSVDEPTSKTSVCHAGSLRTSAI